MPHPLLVLGPNLRVRSAKASFYESFPLGPADTERKLSWAIPSGDIHAGIVRHMRPTSDGNLLIHQSSTNRIILVTLKPPGATQ